MTQNTDDLKILIESSARTFVLFTEDNDHEAENWNYWLELKGNEDELGKFADKLRAALTQVKEEADGKYFTFPYTFLPECVEPELIVDKLIEYGESGYADQHQKIEGVFTCPEDLTGDCEDLYKGGIKSFFAKPGDGE